MKVKKICSHQGFTLTEVMIVITILAVLTGFALLYFGNAKTELQRQRIAREFKVYLERARFDSVKRRAVDSTEMAKITLNSPTAFTATIDLNNNGKLDSTDNRHVDFTQRSNTQIIVADALNYPITILFNQRGHINAFDNSGNAIDPVFTICSKNCAGTPETNRDLTVISISTTGTVAILKDGQTTSALPTPSITNATPELNCYVLLANSNSVSCSEN